MTNPARGHYQVRWRDHAGKLHERNFPSWLDLLTWIRGNVNEFERDILNYKFTEKKKYKFG